MKIDRAKVAVRGAVQGVGFRPFVYRLAAEFALRGWVMNTSQGVFIEAEGEAGAVRSFLEALEKSKPPRAIIQSFEVTFLDPAGYAGFEIRASTGEGDKSAFIMPDVAVCADCLREMLDPADRRYGYPFINCTNCGPRFSIIEALPYDRPNTSMKRFAMCPDCEREYTDPMDRRFHAEPNACPVCGPRLEFWDAGGGGLGLRDEALRGAAVALREGKIVALKGIGGFQLLADARNDEAVARLRARKRRERKPFGVMVPSFDVALAQCEISDLEERLLRSPECPIVLLRSRRGGASPLADAVAPESPNLGVMLPYTPLHHLLMRELGFPVVATSGNLSDEPICIDEHDALKRLDGIADFFLVHDRPIVRHVDDSVARIVGGREMILRRARGYAPLPVHIRATLPPILAVGGHLKNTVALGIGNEVFLSQHIGDLETSQAYSAFRKVISDFQRLYDVTPGTIACDLHPDYLSTKYAAQLSNEVHAVQHHWAHVLSCMAENEIEPPALGVSWDGTGYGADGTIWGGEFLLAAEDGFERVAHFRHFRLPGGGAAIKQPRRAALGLLFEMRGADALSDTTLATVRSFSETERTLLRQMLEKQVNAPVTSSVGRLFDAVASLLDLRHQVSFEGEAAMKVSDVAWTNAAGHYPVSINDGVPRIVDWQPMIEAILADLARNRDIGEIAALFHNTLAETVVAVAESVGEEKVVLSGGCFQNRCLTERCIQRLTEAGFRPYWHQRVPPNDGGIALGQILAAAQSLRKAERDLELEAV